MPPSNHPNPEQHKKLVDAAKKKELSPEKIKEILGIKERVFASPKATAYVNWNTTLALLGPAPASVWFAGVSRPDDSQSNFTQSQDFIRDDLSVGVYYYWVDKELLFKNAQYHFWIEQIDGFDVLFIDIYLDNEIVALYAGTPTVNGEIRGGVYEFGGEGLWSYAK